MDKAAFLDYTRTRTQIPKAVDEGSMAGTDVGFTAEEQDRVRLESDNLRVAAMGMAAEEDEAALSVISEDEVVAGDSGDSQDAVGIEQAELRAEARSELQEVAAREARISAVQMANRFRRGRVAMSGPSMYGKVDQRVFGLEGTEALLELETAGGLYETLMCGKNVMVQYVARTGIGKTTKLSAQIATKCGVRVLLLQPDELLAKSASEAQRDKVRVRRAWSREKIQLVTPMTYADFCGQFQTKNGQMLMEQFDVFVLDEAHVPFAEVYVAKALLATFAPERASVLVLSATMDGDDMQAMNVATKTENVKGRLMDAVRSGKFSEGTRCKDRTMLLVATDEEVNEAADLLNAAGHRVYTLDSANRYSDCVAVRTALAKQSVVKRFLVAVESFGTGHNFPLAAVYSDAARREYVISADTHEVEAVYSPITQAEVKQHAGRVHRGMVEGGRSYVFNGIGPPLVDVDLLKSERLKAFLLLRAAGVTPLPWICPPKTFFPFSITPSVAADILAVNLPCALTVRFFNHDGKLSPAFARALAPFSQVGHHFITSGMGNPIGYDKWIRVPMGGYYGSEMRPESAVVVPFDVKDSSLRVKMHAICAAARGVISLMPYIPAMSDSEGGGETEDVVVVKRGARLPRLVSEGHERERAQPRPDPWAFDVQLSESITRSGNRGMDDAARATIEFLGTAAASERVVGPPEAVVTEEIDNRGVRRVNIMSEAAASGVDSPVDIHTPGGSVVVQLRKSVWEQLAAGVALDEDSTYSLLYGIRNNISGFVKSTAFSNWSNVWLSILKSFAVRANLQLVKRRNLSVVMTGLIHAMYLRYGQAVQTVIESSHVKARAWKRILRGRSVEEQLARDRERGRVEVMQSEAWLRRVTDIRALTASALSVMEKEGIFMPVTVTNVQNVLPIASATNVGHMDVLTSRERGVITSDKRRRRSSRGSSTSGLGSESRF